MGAGFGDAGARERVDERRAARVGQADQRNHDLATIDGAALRGAVRGQQEGRLVRVGLGLRVRNGVRVRARARVRARVRARGSGATPASSPPSLCASSLLSRSVSSPVARTYSGLG